MKARTGNLYRMAWSEIDKIEKMVESYKAMAGQSAEIGHCAACVANDFFRLTNKQWNGKSGAEYFAAIAAILVYKKLF